MQQNNPDPPLEPTSDRLPVPSDKVAHNAKSLATCLPYVMGLRLAKYTSVLRRLGVVKTAKPLTTGAQSTNTVRDPAYRAIIARINDAAISSDESG